MVKDTTPSWCVMHECGLEPLQLNWFRAAVQPPCNPWSRRTNLDIVFLRLWIFLSGSPASPAINPCGKSSLPNETLILGGENSSGQVFFSFYLCAQPSNLFCSLLCISQFNFACLLLVSVAGLFGFS